MMSREEIVRLIRESLVNLVIQVRRGTTTEWQNSTRPLRDGEQGWNKTTKQMYVGDGSKLYPNYDVVGGTGGGGGGGGLSEAQVQAMIDTSLAAHPTAAQVQTMIATAISGISFPPGYVLPSDVLHGVNVVTGNEARPTATIVVWVGGSTEPVNMQDQDVWLAAAPPDTEAPSSPTGLVAFGINETGFSVEWNAAVDNVGVVEYEVQLEGESVGTTTDLFWDFTGLNEGQTYSVQVRARDEAGNWSPTSSSVQVTPEPETALLSFFTDNYLAEMKASTGWAPGTHQEAGGIELGSIFWSSIDGGAGADSFYVHGLRLYTPVGASSGYKTGQITARLYAREYVSDPVDISPVTQASVSKTAVHTTARVDDSWTEILFDEPVLFNPALGGIQDPNEDLVLLTVEIAGGHYMSVPFANMNEFILAHSATPGNSDAPVNSEGPDTIRWPASALRTSFRTPTPSGTFQSGTNWYGVDMIYSVVP